MLNEETMEFMLSHIKKDNPHSMEKPMEIKNDVDEAEAMQIYHEMIQLFARHNVSYQCAVRLSLAWNEALMQGAVELYKIDNP